MTAPLLRTWACTMPLLLLAVAVVADVMFVLDPVSRSTFYASPTCVVLGGGGSGQPQDNDTNANGNPMVYRRYIYGKNDPVENMLQLHLVPDTVTDAVCVGEAATSVFTVVLHDSTDNAIVTSYLYNGTV